jgi:hypothetical protein
MDLAGLDREVDVVVGDQLTEALGDGAQLKLQGTSSCTKRGPAVGTGRRVGPTVTRRPERLRVCLGVIFSRQGAVWHYLGAAGEVTVILPEMMSCLS